MSCEHVIAFATVATVVFGLATATLVAYPSNRLSFLDAIASPSTYPVSGSVIDSFRLEIAIASPSFASLFLRMFSQVLDLVTGEELGVGETGELCFQGPQV